MGYYHAGVAAGHTNQARTKKIAKERLRRTGTYRWLGVAAGGAFAGNNLPFQAAAAAAAAAAADQDTHLEIWDPVVAAADGPGYLCFREEVRRAED